MNGVINIIKPPGYTSHDLVNIVRRVANTKKVGHTGTLDPMAIGVLPVCIGKATKIVDYIQEDVKSYRCEMQFGIETTTQDVWGEITNESEEIPTLKDIEKTIHKFIGEIDQVPPMYSALKVGGQKLYSLAREGKVIKRKARKKTIYSFDIIKYNNGRLLFDISCSKGTYIRSICHDFGIELGTYGVMCFLERTATGPFNLSNGVMLEELKVKGEKYLLENLVDVEDALEGFDRIIVSEKLRYKVEHGVRIDYSRYLKEKAVDQQMYRIYIENTFAGIGQYNKDTNKLLMIKLFI